MNFDPNIAPSSHRSANNTGQNTFAAMKFGSPINNLFLPSQSIKSWPNCIPQHQNPSEIPTHFYTNCIEKANHSSDMSPLCSTQLNSSPPMLIIQTELHRIVQCHTNWYSQSFIHVKTMNYIIIIKITYTTIFTKFVHQAGCKNQKTLGFGNMFPKLNAWWMQFLGSEGNFKS